MECSGRFDIAVAALTVTAARERVVDFTEPFYVTGLGIAVPIGGEASWQPVIRTMTSFGFAQAIAALIGLAVVVGLVVWLVERRHNEHFGGGVTKGLSTGVWWSTVAMTQRHTGDLGPRTLPGRAVAVIWMIVSIVAIAVFTASITSVLTIKISRDQCMKWPIYHPCVLEQLRGPRPRTRFPIPNNLPKLRDSGRRP